MNIHCPNCDSNFTVTIKPTDKTGRVFAPDSPVTPKVLRSVLEFMREVGPGKDTVVDLEHGYAIRAGDRDWPALTKAALVRALQANGAKRWRTATERGYEIPEIPDDQKPAKPAPTVQAKLEREDYEATVIAHSVGRSELNPLPFAIEVPPF